MPVRAAIKIENIGTASLHKFVTPKIICSFEILQMKDYFFIEKDVTEWSEDDSYSQCRSTCRNLRFISDVAERGVSIVQEYNLLTKNKQQKQSLFLEVYKNRKDVSNTKKETLFRF